MKKIKAWAVTVNGVMAKRIDGSLDVIPCRQQLRVAFPWLKNVGAEIIRVEITPLPKEKK